MAKSNIFKELTPEKKAQLKASRLAGRAELSLAYQLGYYVGEQIVDKYLPTLSCDMLQTRKVISVTVAEGDECKRLNDVWFNKIYENKDKIRAKSREKMMAKKIG